MAGHTERARTVRSRALGPLPVAGKGAGTYHAPDQEDVRRGIVEKERPGEAPTDRDSHEERQRLLGEFLSEYAELEPYIIIGRGWSRGWQQSALARFSDEQIHVIDQWNHVYGEEIAAVRQTRNVVVHEPHTVSVETLLGAIANTRQLSGILFRMLGLAGS
jgi:hypothetical protein